TFADVGHRSTQTQPMIPWFPIASFKYQVSSFKLVIDRIPSIVNRQSSIQNISLFVPRDSRSLTPRA
ncbi:MAG: hypothetical protein WCD88_14490, partial [Desulfobacterales bacterium]